MVVGSEQVYQQEVPDAGDVPELRGGSGRLGRAQGKSESRY